VQCVTKTTIAGELLDLFLKRQTHKAHKRSLLFSHSAYTLACLLELGPALRSPGAAFEPDMYESVRSEKRPVGLICSGKLNP